MIIVNNRFVEDQKSCVDQQIVQDPGKSRIDWVKKNVFSRAAYFGLMPLSFIHKTTLVGIGVFMGVVSILSGGTDKDSVHIAKESLSTSRDMISSIYELCLKTINPNAEICPLQPALEPLTQNIYFLAIDLSKSAIPWKANVASRAVYGLLGVVSLVVRATQTVIGVIAATFSILLLGTDSTLNRLAYDNLKGIGIFYDLFDCTMGCINPQLMLGSKG
jgi:hypothetical protein